MRVTGSRLPLLTRCQHWPRLDPPQAPPGEAAQRGTDRHRVLEHPALATDEFTALWGCEGQDAIRVQDEILEWQPALKKGGSVHTELPLAYSPATGKARQLTSRGQRDYSDARPDEVPMTLDLVVVGKGWARVADYKTGRQASLEPAAEHAQLAIGALAVAGAFGAETVEVVLAHVADDGTATLDRHELAPWDLDAWRERVAALMAAVPHAHPQPGPWCADHYCPAVAVCPATREALARTPCEPLSLTIGSHEQAARVYGQLEVAERYLAAVRDSLRDYVQRAGYVPLADGSQLEWATCAREEIQLEGNARASDALGKELLRLAGGDQRKAAEAVQRAVRAKLVLSKESLQAAIALLVARGGKSRAEREVLDALRATGAVAIKGYETIKRRRRAA